MTSQTYPCNSGKTAYSRFSAALSACVECRMLNSILCLRSQLASGQARRCSAGKLCKCNTGSGHGHQAGTRLTKLLTCNAERARQGRVPGNERAVAGRPLARDTQATSQYGTQCTRSYAVGEGFKAEGTDSTTPEPRLARLA